MLRRPLVFALLLLVLGACDTAEPEPDPPPATLAGRWAGEVVSGGTPYRLDVEFAQNQSTISGTGTLQGPAATDAFNVSGSYLHPNLSLQLTYAARAPTTLTGVVDAPRSRIQATLSGSGFGGEALVLTRGQ